VCVYTRMMREKESLNEERKNETSFAYDFFSLAGRKFSELPVSEFACPPRILESPRQVQVFEGENATFDCVFEAVPLPTVKWYLYGRPIANNTLISLHRKFLIFEVRE
jgi:hypothetical protein